LKNYLSEKYKNGKIILEENYVDLKVLLPNETHYFEVKTAGFAEDCIKQGIGQLFSYVNYENDPRTKKIVIFGKNKPNKDEVSFIDFVKKHISQIKFEYLSLEEIEEKN